MIRTRCFAWFPVILLICGAPGPATSASAGPPDLATIQASLESLRKTAAITHIRYKCRIRIVQRSMNEYLEPPRARGVGPFVPAEDMVAEVEYELLRDFRRNRSWSKGADYAVELTKDADGSDGLMGYCEFYEAAFDGRELTRLTPKQNVDPKSLAPGIKIPVEFSRYALQDGAEDPETDLGLYPIHLAEGSLPSPDEPITASRYLPPFAPQKCRLAGCTTIDGKELPVLVSTPVSGGVYDEFVLRSDLGYVPLRWTRYYGRRPYRVVNIAYDSASDTRPRLGGWTVQQYHSTGALDREETYTVQYLSHVDCAPDVKLRLTPTEGMIVLKLNSPNFTSKRMIRSNSARSIKRTISYIGARATGFGSQLAYCSRQSSS